MQMKVNMDALTRMASIAEIRALKATYWFSADTGDWPKLLSTMAEDVVWDSRYERRFAQGLPFVDLPPVADAIAERHPAVIVGRNEAVEFMRVNMAPFAGFHTGGAPIIEIIDDDRASGIWPFLDHLIRDGERFRGYGHYHEEYRLIDGRWLISSIRMTRVARDMEHGEYPIVLGSRKE
jgi:hypothetical protein